jgi:hypothetical protein
MRYLGWLERPSTGLGDRELVAKQWLNGVIMNPRMGDYGVTTGGSSYD